MRHSKIWDVVVWRRSAWFWNGPIFKRDSMMHDDRATAAVHRLAVLRLMLDTEHLARLADGAGKLALARASDLLTGHVRLQMRTSTRGSS